MVTAANARPANPVVVALSGGVDSSVAALLLRDQGYEVECLYMKNWEEDDSDGYCADEDDVEDALSVCDQLGLALNTVNLSGDYWDKVFEVFLSEYRRGRTPNPDVLCNQHVKFRAFLNHVLAAGIGTIATGHYARICESEGRYELHKGADPGKDQSYFLYALAQDQLAHTLFPLGHLHKSEVRAIAKRSGLSTQAKKDSTGICFVGERPFRDFLTRYLPTKPGEIRNLSGDVVGAHQGVHLYTLGQRRGLGIGGVHGHDEQPWYVTGKDNSENVLYVCQGHDHPALFCSGLEANSMHWIAGSPPDSPYACACKTRYRQSDQGCVLERIADDRYSVRFSVPQRGVSPGQSVVFYDAARCVGGGIIDRTFA